MSHLSSRKQTWIQQTSGLIGRYLICLSKLLERLVARQLVGYLDRADLMPTLQSAYRAHHSTETAVLKVMGDLLRMVDKCDVAVLALLDLSAAFDTVDHEILLRRLRVSYGVDNGAIAWLSSYITGRTQYVRYASVNSEPTRVLYGAPQGSVLGPLLFLLYTAYLLGLVKECGLDIHMYADDDQLYGSCRSEDVSILIAKLMMMMMSYAFTHQMMSATSQHFHQRSGDVSALPRVW